MKSILVTLLAFVVLAEGRGMFFPNRSARKCCVPAQFQGTVSEMIAFSKTDGTEAGEESIYIPTIYIDFDNRRSAGSEVVYYNGILVANLTFLSFFDGQTYVVNNTDGKCSISQTPPIDSQLSQCIPDDAKYLGEMTIGHGIQSLKLNTWEGTLNTNTSTVTVQSCLTSFTCMPVMSSFEATSSGYQYVGSWVMSDIKTNIHSSQVFNVPKSCGSQALVSQSSQQMPRGRGGQESMIHALALLKFLRK